MEPERYRGYWKANVSIVRILMIVWGLVSLVFGILLVEPLNAISFGQIPLGFWIAQQGSVFVFVILIFVYAVWMDKVDKKYGLRK